MVRMMDCARVLPSADNLGWKMVVPSVVCWV